MKITKRHAPNGASVTHHDYTDEFDLYLLHGKRLPHGTPLHPHLHVFETPSQPHEYATDHPNYRPKETQ